MGKNVEHGKDEAGYALMGVLVVLILAGIILVPILLLMTASLASSHHREGRMLGFYAADAGIEDAIYNITHDIGLPTDVGEEVAYTLDQELNDSTVGLTIYRADGGTYRITSTATDNNDGRITTIESYVSRGSGGPLPLFDYAIASIDSGLTMTGSAMVT